MIEFTTGDILQADTEALVNTVNCVGIMGRGVALQFKKAFPSNFVAYAAACTREEVRPGHMFVFETGYVGHPKFIINFPTKRHWRGRSRLEDIDAGLVAFVRELRDRKIRSVALPPLGSGLGGLHWPDVRRRIEDALAPLGDVRVVVFEPFSEGMVRQPNPSTKVPRQTPGRAALVVLMHRYLGGLLDPVVTLLELHKLMYFMQEAGQPLRLHYVQGQYGPYAENLRFVLREIDGHMVAGYGDGGEEPGKELRLVPGAVTEAEAFLSSHPDVAARFDRVAALVDGFETPFGLELLSTVHWVVAQHPGLDDKRLVTAVHDWNAHKQQFTERQIALARAVLADQGWLSAASAGPRRH